MKKIFPQTLMMFFILFNYTILRDTKDVLVVTAPKSGAEIIPFLKTYVQLPAAIAFTFLYSILSNRMPQEKVFKAVVSVFLAFFGSFAAFIYPNRGLLHPNVWADKVSLTAPTVILPLIAIIRSASFRDFTSCNGNVSCRVVSCRAVSCHHSTEEHTTADISSLNILMYYGIVRYFYPMKCLLSLALLLAFALRT